MLICEIIILIIINNIFLLYKTRHKVTRVDQEGHVHEMCIEKTQFSGGLTAAASLAIYKYLYITV